ncbi:MAG TPA: serine/threonine-protein kinase, partial [Kofleriaceae bacterium]|nr:serine/threonine-protein kinase [Kofleriaceae bacterium]
MSTGKASELDETLQSGERAEATTAPASGPPGRVRSGEPNDYPELVAVDPKHYVVGHEIARGGMGRILRARDRRLGRTVAIKELLSDSPDGRLRLEREARITARLQHPGIVNVLEAGAWPNSDPFYVMKLVDGESLDRVIARASSLEERLGLLPNVIAVVDALAYAHTQNVIHRDLKPSNILVGAFGETVVIDWGLAKDLVDASGSPDVNVGPDRMVHGETLAGSVLGTPAYMPPEQAEGEPVDQRADVYSLGAILYHTLSGQPPHTGKTIDELLVNVVSGPPPSIGTRVPGLPPDLVAIVDKAMSFAAGDRYPAAKELAADLKKFQTGQLVGAHRYTGWQLVRRWLRRNRAAVAVALVAATFLVALAITSVLGIMRERERTELQRAAAEKSRGQAEDLMSFMLGDLEEKLEPVGKLPLLEVVARKALAYYAERPATRDPQELQGRATALMNIGRVFLKQGAYEDAHVQFEAALAIRRELLERDPTSVPLASATADAHEFLGELYRRQAKLVDAMREYKAMVEILEQLVIREPTRDDHRYLLAVGLERIGWIEKGRGNIDASLESLRRSRDLRLALDPANPEFQLAVSNSNESIGNVLEIRGDLAGAVAEYRASAAIRSELTSRDPTNMKQHFALALSHDHIGSALAAMGDSAGAMDAFRSELRIAENLTERDATNAEWRDLYGLAKKRIGDVLRDRGDRRGALANYTESEAIHEDIVKHDP